MQVKRRKLIKAVVTPALTPSIALLTGLTLTTLASAVYNIWAMTTLFR